MVFKNADFVFKEYFILSLEKMKSIKSPESEPTGMQNCVSFLRRIGITMHTTRRAPAPKISRQLFFSVGATYLWKDLLKIRVVGSRSRSIFLLAPDWTVHAGACHRSLWPLQAHRPATAVEKVSWRCSGRRTSSSSLVVFTPLQREFSPTVQLCISIWAS